MRRAVAFAIAVTACDPAAVIERSGERGAMIEKSGVAGPRSAPDGITDPTHDRWWQQPHDLPVGPVAIEATPAERAHALHLEDLAMIERDLISGRLREAQTLAYVLAGPPDASMAPWPFGTAYVEAAALDVVTAPCLDVAIRSEAQIAVACAHCHVAASQLPQPSVTVKPDGGLSPAARIATHRWAIDRVREGLALPADSPWRDGLAALAEIPPPGTGTESQLQDVARAELETLPELDQRGAAYARLLETCAGCHAEREGGERGELSACAVPR
jgi:hypothetical protein